MVGFTTAEWILAMNKLSLAMIHFSEAADKAMLAWAAFYSACLIAQYPWNPLGTMDYKHLEEICLK